MAEAINMTAEEMETLYEEAKTIYYHVNDIEKIKKANAIFHQLDGYKESAAYAKKTDTMIEFRLGNVVTFGNFEGKPIRWKVLEENGKIRLLFAEDIITNRAFNKERDNVNWEKCTLRRWLNQDFLNQAFTLKERMSIFATRRDNPKNREWSTDCGPKTMDKAFVFNHDEIEHYLPNPEDRGLDEWWWTRTMGHNVLSAECVYMDGSIYDIGLNIAQTEIGVRPCIWVMLR